jgi:hypothetical protein
MTYCLAWKLPNAIFFVADAVVTGGGGLPREQTSSFGEAHKFAPQKVEQGALKIFHLPLHRGLTFSGDIPSGVALANAMSHFSVRNESLEAAATHALASMSPTPNGTDLIAIVRFLPIAARETT